MITYVQRGDILDYTPETDTPAGTPVKIGDIVGITKLDIKAGQLGAIALTGVYEAPKPEGEEIAAGAAVAYDGRTYEVMAPGGEPVWRWSDPYHQVYRIHTKCVSEE